LLLSIEKGVRLGFTGERLRVVIPKINPKIKLNRREEESFSTKNPT
jgi:hypothetical protein